MYLLACAWGGTLLLLPVMGGATPPPSVRTAQPHRGGAGTEQYAEMYRVHRIGNVGLGLTNWGQFGSSRWFGSRDYCTGRTVGSLEYPVGSGVDYLAVGSLWIGAIRGQDTLVSIGTDGWEGHSEFFPLPVPDGAIEERTNRPAVRFSSLSPCADLYFSEDAVSEQDFITYYYDTVRNAQLVEPDPFDGRPHIPIGVEVAQRSYAWSFGYARNFILMDLDLRNLSGDLLQQLYVGIFMDHDVGHFETNFLDFSWDDISGFIRTAPSPVVPGYLDTLNIAWSADNNGDPLVGQFEPVSPTGVAGVRVVRTPSSDTRFAFNWWVSNANITRDWGPNRRDSKLVFERGNLGTPLGDVARYQMLSNGEFDFDQVEAAIDHQAQGWLPPNNDPRMAAEIADGFDTRYLLSFGPFELKPDSVLGLTLAFLVGTDMHVDPGNFGRFFDPARPDAFIDRLDFTSLINNARWAGWVYDAPGHDTDGDGFRGTYRVVRGDTVFVTGDGVPDFKGPPPPPAPELRFQTSEGRILVRWNGLLSETSVDFFSRVVDFEGYRVYMSRTPYAEDFALLASRDRINYVRRKYRAVAHRWIIDGAPLTIDSLARLYGPLTDTTFGFPFHPDSFRVQTVDRALREIRVDEVDPGVLDTNYYTFEPYDANTRVDDTAAAVLASCCGQDVLGVIRKRYPFAQPADTIYDEGVAYPAYYEYEFAIDGLQLAEPVYVSVTAFDFGDPAAGLESLESSPDLNAREVWPVNSAEVVKSSRPKPGVFPNPYRLADGYNAAGWEDRLGEGLDPERARRLTFTNIPDTCTISIWSLDGDLVRELKHAEPPGSPQATVAVWDLITRNTQAVKTGIYLYTIESRFGTDLGKLVIIK